MSKCTRVIAIFLLLACLSQPVAWAQQAQEGPGIENFLDGANGGRGPVMQSVFWNTLYGSLWGGDRNILSLSLWSRISRIDFGKYDHRGVDGLWSWTLSSNQWFQF